jgi:hypothetical protein
MAVGGGENDNIFWPGYVDAISNLVLNLLFVVAILTIAVFLFAIELGRKQGVQAGALDKDRGVPIKTAEQQEKVEKARLEEEVNTLRKQVATLKAAAATAVVPVPSNEVPLTAPVSETAPAATNAATEGRATPKRVEATEKLPQAEKEIEKIQYRGAAVVIDFNADAVTLTKNEVGEARKALGSVASSGGARLEVNVPGSFSETRRLAFYRAMAVRNVLIEMGVPVAKIDVAIKEAKSGGDSTKVLVRGLK